MRRFLPVLFVLLAPAARTQPAAVLDPLQNYADRLELLDLVRAAHPYPDGWSDHRDGIGVQSTWQDESQRDLLGWWSNANWTLTVWPFQILQKYRGEFPGVTVVQPPGWKYQIPPSIVTAVLAYYDELDWVRANAASISAWMKPWHEWKLQRLFWDWHHQAVMTGIQRNADLLAQLPAGERQFAESWSTMVGILKALNFPTTFESVALFNNTTFPDAWVMESDYDLTEPSLLSWPQRITLKGMWAIHKFEKKWGHPITKLLGWLVTTPEKAAKAAMLLHQALTKGWSAWKLWSKLWDL